MKVLKTELTINKDFFYKILDHLYTEGISVEDYLLQLIEKDLNLVISSEIKKEDLSSIIFLGNDFTFSKDKEKIYSKDNKEIFLTRMEEKVFKLLINNLNSVVSIEEFYSNIWKSKHVSIHRLRNLIMSIRKKLYPELIINVSNRGYSISIVDSLT